MHKLRTQYKIYAGKDKLMNSLAYHLSRPPRGLSPPRTGRGIWDVVKKRKGKAAAKPWAEKVIVKEGGCL